MSRRGGQGGGKKGDYVVGKGRPPAEHKWRPGRSGNPKGRPSKIKVGELPFDPADRPTNDVFAAEAYRLVTLTENGQPITLPMIQAIARSLGHKAVKGNAAAARVFVDAVRGTENAAETERVERIRLALLLMEKANDLFYWCKERGLDTDWLRPHPEDIEINFDTGDVRINGPLTDDQCEAMRMFLALRDEDHDHLDRSVAVVLEEGDDAALALGREIKRAKMELTNELLPRRFRRPPWTDADFQRRLAEARASASLDAHRT